MTILSISDYKYLRRGRETSIKVLYGQKSMFKEAPGAKNINQFYANGGQLLTRLRDRKTSTRIP